MSPVLDFSLDLVWLLACGTLGLVLLLIMGLLLLRWVRWRNEPRQQAFQARWRLLLMRCAVGDDVFAELPAMSSRERWPFIKLWLHGLMSLKGPARERLARMAQTLGCGPWALAQLDSRYAAERLMAILALGFLKEASAAPVLLQQLHKGGNQTAVHAARALLDIDATAHAASVVRCLLDRRDLDFSLVAVMLKPFGASLQAAWMATAPAAASDDVQILPWLRLARALALQLPSGVLQSFLQAPHGTDVLIAAIRLVQGESGTREVAALAGHADWLPCRLQGSTAPFAVVALGKAAAVQPADLVAHLKPGIFNGYGHAVIGAGAAEGQQVAAGLQHAQALGPGFHLKGHVTAIPGHAHEAGRHAGSAVRGLVAGACLARAALLAGGQVIRRVGHYAVNARINQRAQHLAAIALKDADAHAFAPRRQAGFTLPLELAAGITTFGTRSM